MTIKFSKSNHLLRRFHDVIPGGAHTYAKGDDQFPEGMAPIIVRGKGCHIWDVDGNEFIEYGAGLRSVSLGHSFQSVVDAVQRQLALGSNFVRPSRAVGRIFEIIFRMENSMRARFSRMWDWTSDGIPFQPFR